MDWQEPSEFESPSQGQAMTSVDRYNLSILSWNIQSAIDGTSKTPKADDNDFRQIISKNDIICLQETIKDIKIPGYRSFSSLRPGTNINHGVVVSLILNKLTRHPDIETLQEFLP